ncbi:hypothetical protein IF2G_07177 [Cordyceps javanica]|nr:hypothetical protein IF2G_07177 [Cordyceps javanica]
MDGFGMIGALALRRRTTELFPHAKAKDFPHQGTAKLDARCDVNLQGRRDVKDDCHSWLYSTTQIARAVSGPHFDDNNGRLRLDLEYIREVSAPGAFLGTIRNEKIK